MSFTNFDSRHFSAAEKTAVNTALASIELAVSTKLANLSPSERFKPVIASGVQRSEAITLNYETRIYIHNN
jgi:hypothetical protein